MKRLVVALALLVAPSGLTFACKCAPPPHNLNLHTRRDWAEWRLQHAQVVFEGKVQKIAAVGWLWKPEPGKTVPNEIGILVTFSDVRLYRGARPRNFAIRTGIGTGDCGYYFKTGESYLVHAWPESGQLATNICSGTARLEDAGAELRLLRGEAAKPEDVIDLDTERDQTPVTTSQDQICGKVTFPSGARPSPVTVRIFPDGDHPISLVGDDIETKSDGSFCIGWFEPGKFLLGASETDTSSSQVRYVGYYPGVLERSQAAFIELKSGGGTVRADFKLVRQPLYTVQGYLRGAPESMLQSAQVFLLSEQMDALHVPEIVSPGPHGAFELRSVPPGHYMVFAARESDQDDSMTYISSVAKLDVHGNVVGLKLDFVAPK